jgi:endonuclease III
MVNFGLLRNDLFSLLLIDFAEAICKSRDLLCPQCSINDLCIQYETRHSK